MVRTIPNGIFGDLRTLQNEFELLMQDILKELVLIFLSSHSTYKIYYFINISIHIYYESLVLTNLPYTKMYIN